MFIRTRSARNRISEDWALVVFICFFFPPWRALSSHWEVFFTKRNIAMSSCFIVKLVNCEWGAMSHLGRSKRTFIRGDIQVCTLGNGHANEFHPKDKIFGEIKRK